MERIEIQGVPADIIANNLTLSYLIHPGEMIKDEIEARGISQKELAAEIGKSDCSFMAKLAKARRIASCLKM